MEVLMKRVLVASFAVLAGTYGLKANAQDVAQPGYFERQMAAPTRAFEIGVQGLYNQGWGNLTDTAGAIAAGTGRQVQNVAGAGVGGELDLSYRMSPQMAVGVFGNFSEYNQDAVLATGTNVRSLATGIQAKWFARPYHVVNPWVGLGSAFRGHWIVPEVGGVTSRWGWEIARLQVGADLRASREISIGPFAAGGLDIFLGESIPGLGARNLSGPPAAFFFSAGLVGRFDVGGSYVTRESAVARR
jgi:hypothetical protein